MAPRRRRETREQCQDHITQFKMGKEATVKDVDMLTGEEQL